MARVYAVEDPSTGRHRAVKLLTERGMAWTRFGREYRALARLDHPNIVKVYRYGVDEHHQAYLVMELLEGEPVQEWVARFGEPGDPRRTGAVICVLGGVARALAYLHSRRLIHRDLKSANVLVLADGTAKLLDFGATRSIGPDDSAITRLGEFVGTFTYASPEQIEGDKQDERSDVYSLGVLAYRLLCGRPPFEADSIVALTRLHFEARPEPLHLRVPGIPEPLSALVLTMLAKRPGDRVQSAAEVVEALERMAQPGDAERPDRARRDDAPVRLVGRRAALQSLQAMVERARPGRMAVVVGRPGSGRDRMLQEAEALAAAAGFLPYRARADATGRVVITTPQGETDLDGLLRELEHGGQPAMLLLRRLGRVGEPELGALTRFRSAAVERALPVLLVAGLAEQADGAALRIAFMDATRVALRPLTRGEVAALVDSMVGEGATSRRTQQRIFRDTGAQPGFVVRVVQAMKTEGLFVPERSSAGYTRWVDRSRGRITVPAPVRKALAQQLSALSTQHTRALVAVALAGDAAHPSVLAKALGASPAELERILGELQRQGILTPPGGDRTASFTVKLTEPALLSRLGDRDRELLVERLARALPAPRPSLSSVQLLVEARQHEAAQEELVRCYLASHTGHALAQRIPLVGSVVERAGRRRLAHPSVLARLELCWARAVAAIELDDPRVDEALDRARELVVTPEAGAEVALERARIHGLRGEGPDQDRALAEAEAALSHGGKPGLAHHVQLARSGHALRSGALELAEQRAVHGLALATRGRDAHGEGRARIAHAVALRARGRLEQADGQLVGARARLARDAGGRNVWLADLERARLLRLQGRLSEALDLLEQPLEQAQEASDAPRILAMVPAMVELELDLYRLGEARELLAELEDMGLVARHPVTAADLALARGRLLLASGAPGEAIEALSEAVAAADDAGLGVAARRLQACLGEALAGASDPERGAAASNLAVRGLAAVGHLPALAEACAARMRGQGERIDPAACFQPVLPWLTDQPVRLCRMTYLLATAEHAAARGDGRGAHYAYQDASLLLDEITDLLSDEVRAAFRVHPWFRQVKRGESQGSAWRGRR